jgi:uncharacterized protein YjbI with pentapeptide repeats
MIIRSAAIDRGNALPSARAPPVDRGADRRWADLSKADLNGANLSGADLNNAVLNGADRRGARLNDTVFGK